jgi:hypothetical protein
MAASQSTQHSKSEKTCQSRQLTVRYLPGAARSGNYPQLSFGGRWLEQLGFAVGSKVKLDVSEGRLVIERIPQGEVLKADALRRLSIAEAMLMVVDQPATKKMVDAPERNLL